MSDANLRLRLLRARYRRWKVERRRAVPRPVLIRLRAVGVIAVVIGIVVQSVAGWEGPATAGAAPRVESVVSTELITDSIEIELAAVPEGAISLVVATRAASSDDEITSPDGWEAVQRIDHPDQLLYQVVFQGPSGVEAVAGEWSFTEAAATSLAHLVIAGADGSLLRAGAVTPVGSDVTTAPLSFASADDSLILDVVSFDAVDHVMVPAGTAGEHAGAIESASMGVVSRVAGAGEVPETAYPLASGSLHAGLASRLVLAPAVDRSPDDRPPIDDAGSTTTSSTLPVSSTTTTAPTTSSSSTTSTTAPPESNDDEGGFGVLSACTTDSDSDGLWDCEEDADTDGDDNPATTPGPDTDGDGTADYLDSDDDGDGTPTVAENADPNGDGDPRDARDSDRDGQPDYLDGPTSATGGAVASLQKISETQGGLSTALENYAFFGTSVTGLGDLDGDGVVDIAVGARGEDNDTSINYTDRGSAYVLLLNADGTVKSEQEITAGTGGFGALDDGDNFGRSVAGPGDVDGDGVPDLVVGAIYDDDGSSDPNANWGAVYVLFLNRNGSVRAQQKISAVAGGLSGPLGNADWFGTSITALGDVDGDGVPDVAVGAEGDDDGGSNRGAVYVLFLNPDGTVKAEQKISSTSGGLSAVLANSDWFGSSVAGLGDLDGDGVPDIAVGARQDDDGGLPTLSRLGCCVYPDRGAIHVLFLNPDGTVKADQKISDTNGDLAAVLDNTDEFGFSVAGAGDLDGDGVPDLLAGARFDDDGDANQGAVYVLFLNADGTVKATRKISESSGGLDPLLLAPSDGFGSGLAAVGDLDRDGTIGIVVGSPNHFDGGAGRGTVHVLDLVANLCGGEADGDGLLDCEEDADSDSDANPATTPGPETDGDGLANYLDSDDDGDGIPTASEGADPDGDGDPRDALDSDRDGQADWLDAPTSAAAGLVASEQKISDTEGGLSAVLDDTDSFGVSVSSVGDLDGDGIADVVVGASRDDDGGTDQGALHVLFLNADGTVKAEQKISEVIGGLGNALGASDFFGSSVSGVGDLDGDGVADVVVGAPGADVGGTDRGAVHILFLDSDGTVKAAGSAGGARRQISGTTGSLGAVPDDSDLFGASVAGLGDVDGDGTLDIAVGAPGDDDGGTDRGAVYVLLLEPDGMVRASQKISGTAGGLAAVLDDSDQFGAAIAGIGDLDGDGVPDVAVGAPYDDDGGSDRGAVHVLFLNPDGTVKAEQKISDSTGGLAELSYDTGLFGSAIGGVGDLDDDGTFDLVVGAPGDGDGGTERGAVHVLFLNPDGTVNAESKLSDTIGALTATLDDGDRFGWSATGVGDLDGDGAIGLVVGAFGDDDGGPDRGALHVLDLTLDLPDPCIVDSDSDGLWDCEEDANADADDNPASSPGPDTDGDGVPNHLDSDDDGDGIPTASENADPNGDGDPRDAEDSDRDGQPDWLDAPTVAAGGSVATEQKISDTEGGLTATLDDHDNFGRSVASIGDIDGDGIVDVAVGARSDDDGGIDQGAAYVLFLNPDGTVRAEQKVSALAGGLTGPLDNSDWFGTAVTALGDLDGDGVPDLAVGAPLDDDGGSGRGAMYVLLLNSDGTVKAEQKISDTAGGLGAALDDGDGFGWSASGMGDLDGDGTPDLVVGAALGDDGGSGRGAVYVLFLNSDGTVKAEQKISDTSGGMGDLDGDGTPDLVVGAALGDDGGSGRGAVYVLFLNSDGTVKAEQKISDTSGGLDTTLDDHDNFGSSVTGVGDIDDDGIADVAVGANQDDDGGSETGAVYVLFLNMDGTVKAEQKISSITGALTAPLDDYDYFGTSAAGIGDVDGDGTPDLAVGAYLDDDGGFSRGATHVLFLNADGTVKAEQKISDTEGGFTANLDDHDQFGISVAGLGDLDGDGSIGLVVGAASDGDGGPDRGSVYVLDLSLPDPCSADADSDGLWDCEEDANGDGDNDPATNPGPDTDGDGIANYLDSDDDGDGIPTGSENADPNGDGDPRDALDADRDGQPDWLDTPTSASAGVVATEQKISDTEGGLAAELNDSDKFGESATAIGDLDGDGVLDVSVGARRDDDGGSDRGAVYVLFLNPDGTVKAEQKISDTDGNLTAALDDSDFFGESVAGVGDVDGDGVPDLAVGVLLDDDGGSDRGAVYVLFLNPDGTVKAEQKISDTEGGLAAALDDSDQFGSAVSGVGDLDGDGIPDMVVGARSDDDGGSLISARGAVYVLFLNPDGTVKAEQKISDTEGGLAAALDNSDYFGSAVAGLGDVDGNGIPDIAVGVPLDDDGGNSRGAVYVLFLAADGTVASEQKISSTSGGMAAVLDNADWFGASVAGVGDLDRDGTPDIAVGAVMDDDGGSNRGAVHVLFLNPDGSVRAEQKISDTEGNLTAALDDSDSLGVSVAGLGDLEGNRTVGILVGAEADDDGGTDRGAVYVLDLISGHCVTDRDSDGLWDCEEDANRDADDDPATNSGPDTDGDGTANYLDSDDDGDGIPTVSENADPNGDGDPRDAVDSDLDGEPDWLDAPTSPSSGWVESEVKISHESGGLPAVLDDADDFGNSVRAVGDVDGDGTTDVAVGAIGDDDGGTNRGAVYVLFLNPDGTVKSAQKISGADGQRLEGELDDYDYFGVAVAGVGDLDGDGVPDLVVGASRDDDGGTDRGAVYVLFLNPDGTVKAEQKISDTTGGLAAALDSSPAGDEFGSSVVGLGDVDGDGVPDVAVGADYDDDGGPDRGAVYVLFLNPDGTVKAEQKISASSGGLSTALDDYDFFGDALGSPGDLDGDDIGDLMVGSRGDDDGGSARGAVYVLFLNPDGTVKAEQKISDTAGGFAGVLDNSDFFGSAVSGIGDLDGDGVPDVAVGARGDDDGGTTQVGASGRGAVYVLFLNPDGTVRAEQKISDTEGGLTAVLDNGDDFGEVAAVGDLDGDGSVSLAVGALGDDYGPGDSRGAVYVLDLALNHAPVAADDSDSIPEDGSSTVDVLGNDTDADGDVLSVTSVTQGSNGAVVDNGDGTITYTPDPDWHGIDTYTYTVSDGAATDTATVTVTVNAVNDFPVASDDSDSIPEDGSSTVNVLSNDSDTDGDTLSVLSITQPANGTATDNGDGTITYTPDADWHGVDTYTYLVTDGALTDTATVTITVTPVNDAPVAADDSDSIPEDGSSTVDVLGNDTDADGDVLSVTSVTQGSNGAVVDNGDGTITYTPDSGFAGIDSYTYTVSDGIASDTATVTISVATPNTPPVAFDDSDAIAEDGSSTIDVVANDTDADGDIIAVASVTQPSNGTAADNGDGTITYTPNSDWHGTDSFTYAVSDGLESDTATVTVTVSAVNDAPVAVDDVITMTEDESEVVDVLGNDFDVDGDMLRLATVGGAFGGKPVIVNDHSVRFVPDPDHAGAAGFSYTIDDGTSASEAVVTIDVVAVNDAPRFIDTGFEIGESTGVGEEIGLVVALDPEGDTVTFSGSSSDVSLEADGRLLLLREVSAGALLTMPVTATDTHGAWATTWVEVDVVPDNRAPTVADTSVTLPPTFADREVVVAMSASDPDGDPVTWTMQGGPGWTIDRITGEVRRGELPGIGTAVSFPVTATDPSGASGTGTLTIEVVASEFGNRPPTAVDDVVELAEDGRVALDVLANDFDPDGDPLTVTLLTSPSHGSVSDAAAGLVYVPEKDWFGEELLEYRVSDERGETSEATVAIIVTPVNDAPVVSGLRADVPAGQSSDLPIPPFFDPDGDELALEIVGLADVAADLDVASGVIAVTPDEGFEGATDFAVVAVDPSGAKGSGSVVLTVSTGKTSVSVELLDAGDTSPEPSEALPPSQPSGLGLLIVRVVEALAAMWATRLPLAILIALLIWSLFVSRRIHVRLGTTPLPLGSGRASSWSVVLVPEGQTLPMYSGPDSSHEIVTRLDPLGRDLPGTGSLCQTAGVLWVELEVDGVRGWVQADHLVSSSRAPLTMEAVGRVLEKLVEASRGKADVETVISGRGLYVSHHAAPLHLTRNRVPDALSDPSSLRWWESHGRTPDVRGSFTDVVVSPVLDAMVETSLKGLSTSPLPGEVLHEFANFEAIALGTSERGWILCFEGTADRTPQLVAAMKRGAINPAAQVLENV